MRFGREGKKLVSRPLTFFSLPEPISGGIEIRRLLELVGMSYRFSKVKAQFLRDYPELPTPSGMVSVRRGEELELPRWQAHLLRALGYVEIKEIPVDISYINKYHFKERKSVGNVLEPLPADFYFKASQLIASLDALIRREPSQAALRDREAAERHLVELAERRLTKILVAAASEPKEARARVTPEEEILLLALSEAVEAWREHLRRVARGGAVE